MMTDELMDAGDAFHPFGQPSSGQTPAALVLDLHVVVGLG